MDLTYLYLCFVGEDLLDMLNNSEMLKLKQRQFSIFYRNLPKAGRGTNAVVDLLDFVLLLFT